MLSSLPYFPYQRPPPPQQRHPQNLVQSGHHAQSPRYPGKAHVYVVDHYVLYVVISLSAGVAFFDLKINAPRGQIICPHIPKTQLLEQEQDNCREHSHSEKERKKKEHIEILVSSNSVYKISHTRSSQFRDKEFIKKS